MADVARELGVHPTTVSMALKAHPRIPSSTRERVRKMAETMGYRPNPLVSALIAERRKGRIYGKGSTLAFLTAAEGDGWRQSRNYAMLYEEIIRHAEVRGYRVEVFGLKEEGMSPQRLRDVLLYRGIRGIIVCPLPNKQHSIDFDFTDFAGVALGLTLHSPRLDHVAVDYYAIMQMAVNQLLGSGHKRIGFMTNQLTDARVRHLSLGAFLAERYSKPRLLIPPLVFADKEDPSPEIKAQQWWRKWNPDVIITPVRSQYEVLQRWLAEDGLVVPGNLSLLCLDCLPGSSQSGIVQDLSSQARSAVEWVTSRVERAQFGVPSDPQTLLAGGRFQEGAVRE